jgi:hypothetical protein
MRNTGAENALREMRLLCDASDAPACSFVESEVKANRHRDQLDQFVAAVRIASSASSASAAA